MNECRGVEAGWTRWARLKSVVPGFVFSCPFLLSVLLLVAWQFPRVWYTRTDPTLGQFWLDEQNEIEGWSYEWVPVSASAERALVADELVNGEFTRANGDRVRVFSAKRFKESPNEIGLFVHTPDRCWTESGWKMELTEPDVVEMTLHGIPMVFERRIFQSGAGRELVYFGGMVGGQPLPYRLDHNLSVGMKVAMREQRKEGGARFRATDDRFWARIWDSFWSRRPLIGPKQFVRISMPLGAQDAEGKGDALLVEFLARWLRLGANQ